MGTNLRQLRSVLAPAVKRWLVRSGCMRAFRSVRPGRGVAILRYHAICDQTGYAYASPGICVSPAAFERQVRYLVRHYTVVSLPDAVACLRTGRPLPPHAVAITFDDGYADNLAAARVLSRYGATATFYVTAGCIGEEQRFWPAETRQLIGGLAGREVVVDVDGDRRRLPCASPSERLVAVRALSRWMKSVSIPTREAVREQLRVAAGHPSLPRVMLTWPELKEMCGLGMTVGAHTVTHPNLPSAGLAAARDEIVGAKERLEHELGRTVTMFSYPNGGAEVYHTPEIRALVEQAGFEAATTSRNGLADSESDVFALERVGVGEVLENVVFAIEAERLAVRPSRRARAPEVSSTRGLS